MNYSKEFRESCVKGALFIAILAQLISLVIYKGFHLPFAFGLVVGLFSSITNFTLIAVSMHILLNKKLQGLKLKLLYIFTYIIRLIVGAAGFFIVYFYSLTLPSIVGWFIGFLSIWIAVYIVTFSKK